MTYNDTARIDETLNRMAYECVDSQTGAVLRTVPGAKRTMLRRWADKKDMAYGAVRYIVRPVKVS